MASKQLVTISGAVEQVNGKVEHVFPLADKILAWLEKDAE